ncbi:MAG TPA: hypothetical protein VNJ04_01220 [Gemmatimonadaceae bacterium]|nr:hypothetical protein [Gemmatimonadaceae bacterium]
MKVTNLPDTAYVIYKDPAFSLPFGIGLRIPSYDRVNGLTLPFGPHYEPDESLQVDGIVSYRSHLGELDLSIEGLYKPAENSELKAFFGRGTFTNDGWIRSNLVNTAASFFVGSDARNYFRADRAEARFTQTLGLSGTTLTPFIGARTERDWSTGSLDPRSSPWSVFGRTDSLKMRRPNPRVARGRISSALAGTGVDFARSDLKAQFDASVEHAFSSSLEPGCYAIPPNAACISASPVANRALDDKFTQATLGSVVAFPTFGNQTFAFKGHAVLTGGGIAPPQRYAYLGGAGTLATVDLLAIGGDRLLFVQGDYTIPFENIKIKFLGSPYVVLQYAAGSAGVGRLPTLIQNLGVGAGVSFFRIDYTIDPASNRSPFSRRSAFSIGVSLTL